jgi:hypothetical protein
MPARHSDGDVFCLMPREIAMTRWCCVQAHQLGAAHRLLLLNEARALLESTRFFAGATGNVAQIKGVRCEKK